MDGKFERVSDVNQLIPSSSTKSYKESEAVEVYWDAFPEANYSSGRTTEIFDQHLWNKDKVGAWKRDHGKVDYSIYRIIYTLEPSNGLCVLTIHIGASYM